jgi:two-component system OmpR family response regulator
VLIHYIEDDDTLRRYVTQGLQEAGHLVHAYADGAEGYQALLKTPAELLLVDWQLPSLDGVTLIERVRQAGMTLPILLLTVRDQIDDRVRGLDSGADDFLTKPFAFEELLARIRAVSRRPPALTDGVLRCAKLEMDLLKRSVTWAGRPLTLTAKEFVLLEFLARRAGQAVSKTVISQGVWERDYDGRSNLLEVFIARLRQKLAVVGALPLIETIKGTGYRLNPDS